MSEDDLESLTSRLLVALYVIVFAGLVTLMLLANRDKPTKVQPRSPFHAKP